MGRVEGKIALITGGAAGLGAEHARVLTREGAKVVITDIQEDLGRALADEVPGVIYRHHDVRDEARWREVVAQTINDFGKIDILVNNAGLVRFATIEEMSYTDYKLQIDVMLDGAFLGCKTVIPHMAKLESASIINVSSISAIRGVAVTPAYAAAKGGIIAMTRSIAVHCQERGYRIRCNAIAPGATETAMTEQAMSELAARFDNLEARRERMGKPIDVANLVLFLASEESRQITGTTIVIDNGETA